ncbi:unnamed protein product [Notodromas monacha]|uniref:G-protein coupled receptors family 1 profile domain-containing protein n=1 Tax=Notodromas monacha TaxID=399045 RepID=A0A7R9BQI4_9CRUS|nr:unnamed protein product [Notodromas monacha]CAG0918469.1 unnamed protein product [Notodromas monacha]
MAEEMLREVDYILEVEEQRIEDQLLSILGNETHPVNDTLGFKSTRALPWHEVLMIIILAVITLITIVGNVLVILSVFTYKPLRMVQNFFIVSLAAADLTVALLVLPFNIAYLILDGKWIFGIIVCEMWLTCDVMCCTASILNLCAIALDRYWAITDPINYQQKRTLKRVSWMIAGVWVLSLIICAPPLIGWNDWPENFDENTPCTLTQEKGYIIYSSSGSFFIPLVIMSVVYLKIYLAMRTRLRRRAKASQLPKTASASLPLQKRRAKGRKSSGSDEHVDTSHVRRHSSLEEGLENGCSSHPALTAAARNMAQTAASNNNTTGDGQQKRPTSVYHFIEQKQKISLSKERKAARTLGIIMGVFVVCWLPFFLMYVVCPFLNVVPDEYLAQFITWLGYINSALNPVIYTIFNEEFRKAFSKLLRCKL